MNQTFKSLSAGLDWMFPKVCYGCHESHKPEQTSNLCIFCWESMARVQHIKTKDDQLTILSAGLYQDSLKRIVTQAKFNGNSMCLELIFQLLFHALTKTSLSFDGITSVPADYWRSLCRGRDLPGTVATEIANQLKIEFRTHWLKKGRTVQQQSKLTSKQREHNLVGAFEASSEIHGKKILVIDDIMTTGSTIRACYKAMKRHKPAHVVFLTIAKTPF